MFNSNRLKIARERRGLSKSELAAKIHVDLRSITGYEKEEFAPSKENLKKISEVLDFPLGWFSGKNIDVLSVENVSFRSLKRMSATTRDVALSSGVIAFLLNDWIEKEFILPELDIPDISMEDPELAAMTLRECWKLGEYPINNIINLLEAKGIRVFSLSEDSLDVDAYSTWRNSQAYIFLNMQKSSERSRFDAAHELGHLLLHKNRANKGKEAEKEADKFASAFLMPRQGLFSNPCNLTINNLIILKKYWKVSLAALIYRLHDLDIISEWEYRRLYIEISKQGFLKKEPEEGIRERSQILTKIFQMLLKEGKDLSFISNNLNINITELNKIMFKIAVSNPNNIRTGRGKPNLRLVK
ncbi:MAG: XRE family transcriptional regulator [Zymomonas mobilis]